MTKPNENQENKNALMSWLTGYIAIYAIGIAAGVFIWKSGMLQKVKGKLFDKTKKENE